MSDDPYAAATYDRLLAETRRFSAEQNKLAVEGAPVSDVLADLRVLKWQVGIRMKFALVFLATFALAWAVIDGLLHGRSQPTFPPGTIITIPGAPK